MGQKVTCKACGKVWLDRMDYMKNPGCNYEGCTTMAKRNNPPAILIPVKQMNAPLKHDKACVCSRCLDARNADEAERIQDRLAAMDAERATVPFKDITEVEEDWDEDNMWTRRYETARSKYQEQFTPPKNNNVKEIVMKHPAPRQVKVRVILRDGPVLDKYDPTEDAMYIDVPQAVGATIYPRG